MEGGMDEKVLKMITRFAAVLTALVCVSLHFFPELHMRAVMAAESAGGQERGGTKDAASPKVEAVVREEQGLSAQLKIELPVGLSAEEIAVSNDCMSQTVSIRFAGGVSEYFSEYSIKGRSDHIAALSYYRDGEQGVIVLELDQICEVRSDFRDDSLYMDLLDPREVYEKIVVVDAGHGGRAPGAVKQGVSEKSIDLSVALALKEIVEEEDGGIGVYFTRTDDTNPTLEQRVQLANRLDADLFISIHNNSSANGSFTSTAGTQVLYSESDESEYSSRRFAQICLDRVVEALGSRSIGLLRGDGIYIIRNSSVPVALIEIGFMTNYEELDNLSDPEYQKKAASGIYRAILQAFEEGF